MTFRQKNGARLESPGAAGVNAIGPVSVVRLGREAGTPAAEIGGKAEMLDQLSRWGIPVPPAWVVPTSTYRSYLERGAASTLRAIGQRVADGAGLRDLLNAVAENDTAAAAADAVQASLERMIPNRLVAERFVARSSAVGEDGSAHSFAGIYESFPGLRWEEMGAGVVLCWASAFTERAEEYRARAEVSPADAPLAVVLQPLVPAVAAGVAFTADPTTGARSYFLLNATWGLGTSLVDGRVQPDQYRIPKGCSDAGRVQAIVGEKGLRDIAGPGGIVSEPTPAEQRTRLALPPRRAIRLTRLLERVEQLAGAPQDVEWAWDGRTLWILQSRPITRLPEPFGPAIEWSRTNYRELYPELPAPLSSSYMELLERDWGADYFRRRGVDVGHLGGFLKIYQGRPYINYSMLKYVTLALGGEVKSNLGSFGTIEETEGSIELSVRRASLRRQIATGWRYWCGRQTALKVLRHIRRCLKAAEKIDAEALSDFALVCRIEDAFLEMQPIDDAANDMGGALSLRRLLLEKLVGKRVAGFDAWVNEITVSGPDNVSVAQALDLLRLGALAREEEEARQFFLGEDRELRSYWVALASTEFLEHLRDFLRQYGHRSLHESDSAVPRFREDPMPILRAIAATVRAADVETPQQRLDRQRTAAAAAWARLWSSLPIWERPLPVRYLLARQTAQTMRVLMRYREGFRSEMARMIGERRRLEMALGRRWQAREYLDRAEDVYWLRLDELQRATEERAFKSVLRSIVRDRKAEYDRLGRMSLPNIIIEAASGIREAAEAPPVEPSEEDGLVLHGQPVSSGMTEGEVRVILRPEDAAGMEPGTILVTPVVGPSWGPLYSVAGGLIVEMGGALSHGAILAREYGLPAVTNIPGVTRALRTGDRVFLNACEGVVWRAPERSRSAIQGKTESPSELPEA